MIEFKTCTSTTYYCRLTEEDEKKVRARAEEIKANSHFASWSNPSEDYYLERAIKELDDENEIDIYKDSKEILYYTGDVYSVQDNKEC